TYVAPDGAPGAEVLSRSPMVTLVGPPGVGKSRLAARLAQDSGIADIYWLDLADETFQRRPDETIRSALAGLLGVRPTAQRLAEAAGEVLAGSPTLIVFDNADRMADVVAEWSEELLEACPDLRVVVTSRFALGSRSEKVFTVDPLQPDLAVELLLDRAPEAGVNSHDELTRLVEQVDRIPLGIELIAPHLAALDAEEVADRLAQSLELASGRGRLDARHRSLEQALAWSADLLDDVDRDLLATMTVHNGSVTPPPVVELMGGERPAVLAGLQRLNQYGLVRPTSRGRGQRWSTPNSVRTYVRTRLVAERELAQRLQAHAEHHLGRVVDLAAELAGEREERAVAELRKLADQLPAAHHWFVERGRVRESADFSLAMWEYGFFRQDYATYDWLLETLELDGVDQLDDHPEILGQGALAAWAQDRLLLAERLATQAESEAGRRDQPVPIAAHKARFNVAAHQDRTAEAARMLSLMLEVSEERGDVRHHSDNLVVATLGYGQVGLIEEARATAWRAYELVASLGNPTSVSWARVGLGWADMVTDPDRAAQTFAAAARLARTVDNRWVNGMATTGLVTVLRRQGRFDQARRLLIEVTDLWVRARQHGQISRTCQEAILLLARDGASVEDRNRAALLLERFTLEANRLQLLPDDQERFTGLATELAVPATSASGDVPLGRLVIEALVG
ncbi:MAG: AAA family ATPase, partial [Acidimicrobiia bacterium]|nr:AAA family ATPase [Acidimicrobiia bacterium]